MKIANGNATNMSAATAAKAAAGSVSKDAVRSTASDQTEDAIASVIPF